MKLVTLNGELDLPEDFSFEIELNNPFLSDEGDASVPATIPATPNNLKVLDNIHRVDRANKFMKKIPATLMAGTIQKHGQLIIDTLSMKDGISVSLAIENSDLYSQHKEKSLKEIFASKVRDDWNQDIAALANYLLGIRLNHNTDDFTIFPVAVSPYEEDDVKIYQYNNEGTDALIWEARTVREGDILMSVTDGYGVSPFLYLYKLIDLLFQEIGYTVTYNCLDREPYRDIVVLNNCSDTIVKGVICYSDLVPSCTLSEFISFLFNKFGIHVRVNSTSKTVEVVMLQDLLSSAPTIDISSQVVDDLDILIEDTSRVVLSSATSIDGTAPAAETFDKLIERYGYYIEVTEQEYEDICNNNNPAYRDCLIMRRETGEFYELGRKIGTDEIVPKFIGTNYFKYDRSNSSNSESLDSPDVMPAIIYKEIPYMYIGDRLHSNTTYNNSENSSEQSIIIAWKTILVIGSRTITFGTTQKYFAGHKLKDFSLTTYDMYEYFWSRYNELLRNNIVRLKGTVLYDIIDISSLDMTKIKSYRGQKILPLRTVFEISDKLNNKDSEFLLVKEFLDIESDEEILPEDTLKYKWEYQGDEIEKEISNVVSWFPYYFDSNHEYVGSGNDYIPTGIESFIMVYNDCDIEVISGSGDVYLGVPVRDGENSLLFEIEFKLIPQYTVYTYPGQGEVVTEPMMIDFGEIKRKATVKYNSVAI